LKTENDIKEIMNKDIKTEKIASNSTDNTTETVDSNELYAATDLTIKYCVKPTNECESMDLIKQEHKYYRKPIDFEVIDSTLKSDSLQLPIVNNNNNNSNANHQLSSESSLKLTKSKNLKSGNKKSFVWKYFSHPKNVDGIEDRSRTECLECKSQLAFNASGTTTTMLNHLKSRHPKIAECEEYIKLRNSQITGSMDSSSSQNHCQANESPTGTLSPSISFELSKTNNPSPENKTSDINVYSIFPNNHNSENYVSFLIVDI